MVITAWARRTCGTKSCRQQTRPSKAERKQQRWRATLQVEIAATGWMELPLKNILGSTAPPNNLT